MMMTQTVIFILGLVTTALAGGCPNPDLLTSSEAENLINLIQGAKNDGLRVVNVDEDKGEIDTKEFEECDKEKDLFFVPDEYHSPPIFTKVCGGSCPSSEGCAVIEQELRDETVIVYRKVNGVFTPVCETIYFPRHKDCECQVE